MTSPTHLKHRPNYNYMQVVGPMADNPGCIAFGKLVSTMQYIGRRPVRRVICLFICRETPRRSKTTPTDHTAGTTGSPKRFENTTGFSAQAARLTSFHRSFYSTEKLLMRHPALAWSRLGLEDRSIGCHIRPFNQRASHGHLSRRRRGATAQYRPDLPLRPRCFRANAQGLPTDGPMSRRAGRDRTTWRDNGRDRSLCVRVRHGPQRDAGDAQLSRLPQIVVHLDQSRRLPWHSRRKASARRRHRQHRRNLCARWLAW